MLRYLVHFIPIISILLTGFVCGLIRYRRKVQLRPVIILLGVTLAAELSSYYMAIMYRNNMPVSHFFNPVQMIIWAVFFYSVIEDPRIKKAIVWITTAMLVFAVTNSFFLQPIKTFPDNFLKLETMLFVLWGAALFIQQLDSESDVSIFKDSLFVTSVAVLWFNLISFLFFLLYAYMIKHKLPTVTLRTIHQYSNYVYYLLLLTAILLPQKQVQNAGRV
jgi:hypothetical protein